ncbi:MAG: hypothetical protein WC095_02600 [Candidatus Paceibacterota bacterium]
MGQNNNALPFSWVKNKLKEKKNKALRLDRNSKEYIEEWLEIVDFIRRVLELLPEESQERRVMLYELVTALVEGNKLEEAHDALDELRRIKG